LKLPALALAVLALAAAPSFAVELAAVPATATMPDPDGGGPLTGEVIAMWGYVDLGALSTPTTAAAFDCTTVNPTAEWGPPPTLTATAGGVLTINVKNCLSEPTSVFIPGQYKATVPTTFLDGQGRTRVSSFDTETAPGAVGTYTWNGVTAVPGVKEGTYLYHSGTHPQVQVQMGLYGALVVTGPDYPAHDAEQVLLYSEIDPVLHAAVAANDYGPGMTVTSTFEYWPKYFLINGKSFPDTADITVGLSQDVLLRFINAGLKTHVPTLQGLYMTLIAEDGNIQPFTREQYSTELPAAKTIDAILNVGTAGRYALYDRALHLTNAAATGGGMLTYIQAGAAVGAPTAMDQAYSVAEDNPGGLVEAAPGVLTGATAGSGGTMAASLVSDVSAGTLALNADGSFTYTPNANFNGNDQFTYVANDGGPNSNVATVSITVTAVNDAPVAAADAYDAVAGTTLNVAAPGVLGNDSDIDGDSLTAVISGTPTPPTELTFSADGSFVFDATGLTAGDIVTFDYVANDSTVNSAPATVTITVVSAPPPPANIQPVANDDTTSTPQNTPLVNYNIVANDTDPDGTIDPASVVITTGTTTQRGGMVVNNGNGTITYTPKNAGYRGTDTFQYTVNDNDGATSNVATVRVNVTR
jgi:VCBS repeat-containing protein